MAGNTRVPKAELTGVYGAIVKRMSIRMLGLGYFQAHNEGLDVTKAREVPRWHESEYAEAMTRTPPDVTDGLSARLLKAQFSATCGLKPLAVASTA